MRFLAGIFLIFGKIKNMSSITLKRKFFAFFKAWRQLKRNLGDIQKVKEEDRIIIKTVKAMLKREDIKIFYAPISDSIYLQTQDKKYTFIFNEYEIRIANHKLFISIKIGSTSAGNQLMQLGRERIEREMKKVENEVRRNEFNFLNDLTNFLEGKNEEDSKQL